MNSQEWKAKNEPLRQKILELTSKLAKLKDVSGISKDLLLDLQSRVDTLYKAVETL